MRIGRKSTTSSTSGFDSGSTHAFTLEDPKQFPGLAGISRLRDGGRDEVMYLEGSDQHRGWFHSSLLESCGTRGRAPYDAVLTHGFVLDAQGRKMAKSVGNVVAPQTVIKDSGADILRLWVAASDYSDDLRIGPEILKTFVETYKKLRNTIRWMLGALGHYEAGTPIVPQQMGELERLILHRLAELDPDIRDAYSRFDYKRVVARLSMFLNTDLSAFYFDIRKDALYCDAPSSLRRRAALEVIEQVFRCITLWLAPILVFTAEEAWLSRYPEATSIHLEPFPQVPPVWRDDVLAVKWEKVRAVRAVVTGAMELARAEKMIGASLEAAPVVYVADCRAAAGPRRRRSRRRVHHIGYRDRGGRRAGGRVSGCQTCPASRSWCAAPRGANARAPGASRRRSAAIPSFPMSRRATRTRCASWRGRPREGNRTALPSSACGRRWPRHAPFSARTSPSAPTLGHWLQRCRRVPFPLVEKGQGWGFVPPRDACRFGIIVQAARTPTPCPSPQGGGEPHRLDCAPSQEKDVTPRLAGFVVAAATLAIDQGNKLWLMNVYGISERQPVHLLPGLDVIFAKNPGISYSLLSAHSPAARWALVAFTLAATLGIGLWLWRTMTRVPAAGLGLVLGGALGNAIDRFAYGWVADFYYFHVGSFHWYVFNLADVAIVVGVALLLVDSFVLTRPVEAGP